MDLRIHIRCACLAGYDISNNCSVEKISCPNCGKIHPQSDQLIELLRIANAIDVGDPFGADQVMTHVSHQS